ncbi:MAG: TlyA family RNA methyltransferase, partial [Deltaproteobacteria bacterium]|nr:TlyA family RNA methyltransferase [Deltaproteobacteria bacterium]
MNSKVRLDSLLVQRGLAPSLERARALIMAGSVLVQESVVDKAGALVSSEAEIRIKGADIPYVSRGGVKLKGALDSFCLDVRDLVVLDVGSSTGGFTDCLLQRGAASVSAVDVGYGQLAWSLRQDSRVQVFERTNIRAVDPGEIGAPFDLAVIDVSFIGLGVVLPHVVPLLGVSGQLMALVKPQFEAGKGRV